MLKGANDSLPESQCNENFNQSQNGSMFEISDLFCCWLVAIVAENKKLCCIGVLADWYMHRLKVLGSSQMK